MRIGRDGYSSAWAASAAHFATSASITLAHVQLARIASPLPDFYCLRVAYSHRLRHLPKLEFLDLARGRLRQFREHEVARAFVAREILAAPRNELVGRRLLPRLELDEGAGRLAPLVVGFRHHGGRLHRRMLVERILDLDRGDVLSAGDDDVLGAVLELDVPVRMHHPEVAGMKPPAGEGLVGRRLVLEV